MSNCTFQRSFAMNVRQREIGLMREQHAHRLDVRDAAAPWQAENAQSSTSSIRAPAFKSTLTMSALLVLNAACTSSGRSSQAKRALASISPLESIELMIVASFRSTALRKSSSRRSLIGHNIGETSSTCSREQRLARASMSSKPVWSSSAMLTFMYNTSSSVSSDTSVSHWCRSIVCGRL
jgi:hypothetical protein